jgi:hypothetical protein
MVIVVIAATCDAVSGSHNQSIWVSSWAIIYQVRLALSGTIEEQMRNIVHKATVASTRTVDLSACPQWLSNIRFIERDAPEECEAKGRRVGQLRQGVGRRE